MRDFTLKQLRSKDRSKRFAAWPEFMEEVANRGGHLRPKEAGILSQLLRDEEDDGVYRFATTLLFEYILSLLSRGNHCEAMKLDDWVSQFFRRRSALFSTKEEAYQTRDALALAYLARKFPEAIFGETDLQPLPLDDDRLGSLLESQKYETILIVGRPWMFGKYALKLQETAGEKLHLHFPCKKRPASLPPGAISPSYHCIKERFASSPNQIYRTKDQGNTRTDYGLVQVYPKYRDWLTLVMCAGCSSLGTLGAARWFSNHLRTRAIPTPAGIQPDTTMEALVKITANSDQFGWDDPSDIELMRLYVDKFTLNLDTGEWEFAERPVLTVSLEDGSPVSVSFDGDELNFQRGSDNFHLIAYMVLEAAKSDDQTVKIATLARNQDIWTKRGGVAPSYAKRRLQSLNSSKLYSLLSFPSDRVQLNADVEIRQLSMRC